MANATKSILIIDELGFSRICSAILETSGYGTDIITHAHDLPTKLNNQELGLIVTSYPYGAFLFEEIKRHNIPTIILSDNVDEKLISTLRNFDNSYCMIKPIDYDKFKAIVKRVIVDENRPEGDIVWCDRAGMSIKNRHHRDTEAHAERSKN